MIKAIKRGFQDKAYAQVTLEIRAIMIPIDEPYSAIVNWTRGPQVDESCKFELQPGQPKL